MFALVCFCLAVAVDLVALDVYPLDPLDCWQSYMKEMAVSMLFHPRQWFVSSHAGEASRQCAGKDVDRPDDYVSSSVPRAVQLMERKD